MENYHSKESDSYSMHDLNQDDNNNNTTTSTMGGQSNANTQECTTRNIIPKDYFPLRGKISDNVPLLYQAEIEWLQPSEHAAFITNKSLMTETHQKELKTMHKVLFTVCY